MLRGPWDQSVHIYKTWPEIYEVGYKTQTINEQSSEYMTLFNIALHLGNKNVNRLSQQTD